MKIDWKSVIAIVGLVWILATVSSCQTDELVEDIMEDDICFNDAGAPVDCINAFNLFNNKGVSSSKDVVVEEWDPPVFLQLYAHTNPHQGYQSDDDALLTRVDYGVTDNIHKKYWVIYRTPTTHSSERYAEYRIWLNINHALKPIDVAYYEHGDPDPIKTVQEIYKKKQYQQYNNTITSRVFSYYEYSKQKIIILSFWN